MGLFESSVHKSAAKQIAEVLPFVAVQRGQLPYTHPNGSQKLLPAIHLTTPGGFVWDLFTLKDQWYSIRPGSPDDLFPQTPNNFGSTLSTNDVLIVAYVAFAIAAEHRMGLRYNRVAQLSDAQWNEIEASEKMLSNIATYSQSGTVRQFAEHYLEELREIHAATR